MGIRRAAVQDASRLAEILIFNKRINYRDIFRDDRVSFGEMQVLPLARRYAEGGAELENIWVYDDEFVKGMIRIANEWVEELYVDSFFQNEGIGAKLIEFAKEKCGVRYLYVLEKNTRAIRFYQAHGFALTDERKREAGTDVFAVKMARK